MGVDIVFSRSKDQKLRRMVMVDSDCGSTPRDSFIPRRLTEAGTAGMTIPRVVVRRRRRAGHRGRVTARECAANHEDPDD